MAVNLRERLKRIQEIRKFESQLDSPPDDLPCNSPNEDCSKLINLGWKQCGFKTLKREINAPSPFKKSVLPPALAVLVPDLAGRVLPKIEDFLFFDLETSGLYGGSAGTIAFLAAFGKVLSNGKMRITQYLLLDYPGENDFLQNVITELNKEKAVIVTYNGKCFDSQIIKARCLINRIKPPEYPHVDLLHPARRLWKNIIQDCSQKSVEINILGLDRTNDIHGSLAPEIWFEFLKTGETGRLMGICDHNLSDIKGLASILESIIMIAEDPFNAKYDYDAGRLALYWRIFCRRYEYADLQETCAKLLRFAEKKDIQCPLNIKAAILNALAIDSERKQKNSALAMEYVKKALQLTEISENWRNEFERRKDRLEKRIISK
ncbi:ribonuclease H-like domain-containing protein [Treponema sp. R80B11-R83G3]